MVRSNLEPTIASARNRVQCKSLRSALRVPGIVLLSVGVFLITLNIAATAIVKHQAATATESLAREAIPIAAHTLITPLMTNGVVELLLGLVLLALSFSKLGLQYDTNRISNFPS